MEEKKEGFIVKTVTSKNGKEVIFRYPKRDDVDGLLRYFNALSKERTYIRFQGEQVTYTEEQKYVATELERIKNHTAVLLLACDRENIVGSSGIVLQEKIDRHIGIFGISLAPTYRGEGIGRSYMTTVIDEAIINIPALEIITLGVFSTNKKAHALYTSLGFTEYGMLPQGVKLADGYVDHMYMFKRIRDKKKEA